MALAVAVVRTALANYVTIFDWQAAFSIVIAEQLLTSVLDKSFLVQLFHGNTKSFAFSSYKPIKRKTSRETTPQLGAR